MQNITFLVQGSADTPYVVEFKLDDHILTGRCSCKSGIFYHTCKHILAILSGQSSSIVSDNASDVAVVKEMLSNTPLEQAIKELNEAINNYDVAKNHLTNCKKSLEIILTGKYPRK